jgi:hypothetical protein
MNFHVDKCALPGNYNAKLPIKWTRLNPREKRGELQA